MIAHQAQQLEERAHRAAELAGEVAAAAEQQLSLADIRAAHRAFQEQLETLITHSSLLSAALAPPRQD